MVIIVTYESEEESSSDEEDKYVVTGKEFKLKEPKNLVLNLLIILLVRITNISNSFWVSAISRLFNS